VTDRIRVIIVGAGDAANGMHLPAWQNVKEADVVAVCDKNRENTERTAKTGKYPVFTQTSMSY